MKIPIQMPVNWKISPLNSDRSFIALMGLGVILLIVTLISFANKKEGDIPSLSSSAPTAGYSRTESSLGFETPPHDDKSSEEMPKAATLLGDTENKETKEEQILEIPVEEMVDSEHVVEIRKEGKQISEVSVKKEKRSSPSRRTQKRSNWKIVK